MNAKTRWIIITVCIVALVAAAIGIRLAFQAGATPPADQTGPYKVGFVANTYYDSTRSDFAGGPRPILTFICTRPHPITTETRCRPLSTQ